LGHQLILHLICYNSGVRLSGIYYVKI